MCCFTPRTFSRQRSSRVQSLRHGGGRSSTSLQTSRRLDQPGFVRGFGIVFADAEVEESTSMSFYEADDDLLFTKNVLSGLSASLSFLGTSVEIAALRDKEFVSSDRLRAVAEPWRVWSVASRACSSLSLTDDLNSPIQNPGIPIVLVSALGSTPGLPCAPGYRTSGQKQLSALERVSRSMTRATWRS